MMTSAAARRAFLDFFANRGHQIVPSAPIVVKNDPTLMFTNAGMNQFKDIFLGNSPVRYPRVANTQKCLRVSGKHNDLEEVGVDTYHHTMFEMLGNWSFGDYFKEDAIAWAWELLTSVYQIPKDRIYVTVFEGDAAEKLDFDHEAYDFWKKWIAEDRILKGNKKDNFWEMGDTGPCGPCSEIHVDLRHDEDRKVIKGDTLVNGGHPQVIEIWNNVFMQYNRLADGSLEPLPANHVDTGMGFERLCMALQGKTSNYDTDIFQPLIQFISNRCGIKYGAAEKTDIAMRVMADHIRAISFSIADGQLPSNNKAGYVIRRILRRAVRYAYSFLNLKDPVLHSLVPVLAKIFEGQFPELETQQEFIARVIIEEEHSFLKTLESGIRKFEQYQGTKLDGEFAFELYDTFGFPPDLTMLMAREKNMDVDLDGFNKAMEAQKSRSRANAEKELSDWVQVREDDDEVLFTGYDQTEGPCHILRYRIVKTKDSTQYQIVLDRTPFYAESGGQVGDTGSISNDKESIRIIDTKKENNLIVHYASGLPADPSAGFYARIDVQRRRDITANHSATHLMHAALRNVLGNHVAQKGSLVNENVTRFDFSHFTKVTDEEIERIEKIVNDKVRENILLEEKRNVPIQKALELGAMALFGEKYGEFVRVITFDPEFSVELCGGTHVSSTGRIGMFRIRSESSVAAGVRRIEAVTGPVAEAEIRDESKELQEIKNLLKANDPVKELKSVLDEQQQLRKKIEELMHEKASMIKKELLSKISNVNGINMIAEKIDLPSADGIKNISFDLRNHVENLVLLLGASVDGKPHLSLIASDNLVKEKNFNATQIIRTIAKEIQGGGGGQAFYATAGGKNSNGLEKAIAMGREILSAS